MENGGTCIWFVILSSKEIKKDKPIGVVRFGKDIVLWRDENGKVNAIEDFCVHRRARLSAGKVVNGRLQYPFHGFEYDGNGRVKLIPALGRSYNVSERFSVKAYNVAEKAGMVWMRFDDGEPKGEQGSLKTYTKNSPTQGCENSGMFLS